MGRKHNRKNDVYSLRQRRQAVASRYVRGQSQVEIATALGLNQCTISRDLTCIRQQWLDRTMRDFGARQAEELAKLDAMEAEAWRSWDYTCRRVIWVDHERQVVR